MTVHTAKLHPLVHELDKDIRIAFIVADFNPDITHRLLELNTAYLQEKGFTDIDEFHVPGVFELTAATAQVAEKQVHHLIITLGCLITGETPYFDVITQATIQGLAAISAQYPTPLICGLLTCTTLEQAQARVDTNYAIYGLNRVAQHLIIENTLEERYKNMQQQAMKIFQQYDQS